MTDYERREGDRLVKVIGQWAWALPWFRGYSPATA